MKSILALLGLIAIVSSSSIKSTGWGSEPPPPPPPAIDLELVGDLAAVGAGAASASQVLTEHANGDANVPALVASDSGIIAALVQNGEILQVASAGVDGSTSTVNLVDASNEAIAVDSLSAEIIGANVAEVANEGHTDASGWGAVAVDAASVNSVIAKKN